MRAGTELARNFTSRRSFFLYDDDDEEIKNVNFDVNLRHDEEREETRVGEDGKCRMTKQISGS